MGTLRGPTRAGRTTSIITPTLTSVIASTRTAALACSASLLASATAALLATATAVATLSACGGGDDTPAEPDAGPRPTRTVTGTMQFHLVAGPGEDVPIDVDLSRTPISVLVPDSQQTIPGSGSTTGTFLVPGVPVGPYVLHVGNRWLVRESDSVDLSYSIGGRPDARPATTETNLIMDVTDLAPWGPTDWLELYSPSARTAGYDLQEDATSGVPAPGATSLAGFTYDLSAAYSPGLPSAALGDEVVLTQLATRTVGGRVFQSLVRAFTPADFTATDGGKQSLTGAFTTPPATALALTWDRPAFDRELRAHSPGDAPMTSSYARVYALPDGAPRGTYAPGAELLAFLPGFTGDRAALTTTGWSYGDPFPAAWTRILDVRYTTYQFIGDVYKEAGLEQELDLATAGATVTPLLGLPTDVTINGHDATVAQAGVGLTPTIAWGPPTFGAPPYYYVAALEVPATGALVNGPVLETSGHSVTFPPGLLTAGKRYAFEVTAKLEGDLDLDATPFRRALPSAYAHVTTAFMSP
jgi:hypothetical protein